jgi:5-formyltetrahydrofolate cyclo-ligase
MSDISQLKQQFRVQLSEKRKQLSKQEYEHYSNQIMRHLVAFLSDIVTQEPVQLLVYRALPYEVDTLSLFENDNLQVFAPRILPHMNMEWIEANRETSWQSAGFNVLEPEHGEPWKKGDAKTIMLAPLLGFDAEGNRLGMGKGYFDRWLAKHGDGVDVQLGLAFSCQELPKVPTEPHDAPLSTIITECGVRTCPIP